MSDDAASSIFENTRAFLADTIPTWLQALAVEELEERNLQVENVAKVIRDIAIQQIREEYWSHLLKQLGKTREEAVLRIVRALDLSDATQWRYLTATTIPDTYLFVILFAFKADIGRPSERAIQQRVVRFAVPAVREFLAASKCTDCFAPSEETELATIEHVFQKVGQFRDVVEFRNQIRELSASEKAIFREWFIPYVIFRYAVPLQRGT